MDAVKELMLVAVACKNSLGAADMPVYEFEVSAAEVESGYHYELAEEKAKAEGYEEPFLCFDHTEQSALRVAAKRLRLVPTMVVVDNSGGAIHGVSCDDGEIDVLIFGDDTDGVDDDSIESVPVGAGGALTEVWTSHWSAEPSEQAQAVADWCRGAAAAH